MLAGPKTAEHWQRIIAFMDGAYRDYEDGLVALRRRVVDNMGRKVKESGVLDDPREGSTAPRSAPRRKF